MDKFGAVAYATIALKNLIDRGVLKPVKGITEYDILRFLNSEMWSCIDILPEDEDEKREKQIVTQAYNAAQKNLCSEEVKRMKMFIKVFDKDCWINPKYLEEIKIVKDGLGYKLIAYIHDNYSPYTLYQSSTYEDCKKKAETLLTALAEGEEFYLITNKGGEQ